MQPAHCCLQQVFFTCLMFRFSGKKPSSWTKCFSFCSLTWHTLGAAFTMSVVSYDMHITMWLYLTHFRSIKNNPMTLLSSFQINMIMLIIHIYCSKYLHKGNCLFFVGQRYTHKNRKSIENHFYPFINNVHNYEQIWTVSFLLYTVYGHFVNIVTKSVHWVCKWIAFVIF